MISCNESEYNIGEMNNANWTLIKKLKRKPERKPEQKAEQKAEQKPEQKPERKAEQKPERKAEQKAEQKPERKAEQKPERKAEKFNTMKSTNRVCGKPNFDSGANEVLDELSVLPDSIIKAMELRKNLTLKQITSIVKYDGMNLHGLCGEMFNVIHDRIQKHVRRRHVKITHQGRVFSVSLYNWYDLNRIEKMIGEMVFGSEE